MAQISRAHGISASLQLSSSANITACIDKKTSQQPNTACLVRFLQLAQYRIESFSYCKQTVLGFRAHLTQMLRVCTACSPASLYPTGSDKRWMCERSVRSCNGKNVGKNFLTSPFQQATPKRSTLTIFYRCMLEYGVLNTQCTASSRLNQKSHPKGGKTADCSLPDWALCLFPLCPDRVLPFRYRRYQRDFNNAEKWCT